jgi:putative DNA primase/helicase
MSKPNKPDWIAAKAHVAALTGDHSTPVTIQVFDDRHQDGRLAGWRHGRLTDPDLRKWIVSRYKRGAGVFITINETDGAGRRGENITRYRAAFVDLDGTPLPDTWPLEPSFVAESSPGKYHVYWLLQPGTDLDAWLDLQARLAAFYKGDKAMADRARVLRLAGFDHQKTEPFRVHFLGEVDPVGLQFDRHTIQDIAGAHPCEYRAPVYVEPPEAPQTLEWDTSAAIDAARGYLEDVDPPEVGKRNNAAYVAAAKLNDLGISPEKSFELLAEVWNPRLAESLDDDELRHVVRSASRYKKNPPGTDAPVDPNDDFDGEEVPEVGAKKKQATGDIISINAADIVPRNIEFLWENRLALGVHTALAGIGGMAKSQIMYNIVATITTGGEWPDGGRARKDRCIILSAEEGREDMIVPRLMAAGADLKLVEIITATKDEDNTQRKFNLQADLDKLKTFCRNKGDVVFIGFDPVSSYMGGDVDTHRNTAVRHVLDPITQLAEDVGCCILSLTHFNKGSSNKAIHRVMESAAFVNAPRASFGVFEDPDDPHSTLLLLLKTNMKKPNGLRYSVKDKKVADDPKTGKPIIAPYIEWDVMPVNITADDVVRVQTERKTPRLDQAVAFLRNALKDGDKPVNEIKAHAEAECITLGTLRRALDEVGAVAVAVKGHMPPLWVYHIAEDFEDSPL